jgi:hypothetical protein
VLVKAVSTPLPNFFSWSSLPVVAEIGMPMRRSYVVPMRRMVICEYEVAGEALN